MVNLAQEGTHNETVKNLALISSIIDGIEDCAKDGGEEFFTEMHRVPITNL